MKCLHILVVAFSGAALYVLAERLKYTSMLHLQQTLSRLDTLKGTD